MNKLTEQILLSKVDGTYLKLLARLEKYPLLVLDDFGLQTINKELALAILQILEDQYNKKSTIIVSQLPVDKWAQVISDPTIGDAIVDRIIYNAHRIELKGTSMREKSKQNGPAEEPSLSRPTGSSTRLFSRVSSLKQKMQWKPNYLSLLNQFRVVN